ncbi:hypothetical protein Barb7_02798 [Bacteroidales bacterium Barb7]|nr:hypothetical protein Barb7_02798 [Bacteroidales bacterium Barb7]
MQAAAFLSVEIEEIVALQQLVGKFGERHTRIVFRRQAFLDGILRHHIIDGKMFPHIADKVEEGILLHPVVVVHQFGGIGCIGIKVEKLRQLFPDALLIAAEGRLVQQVALGGLHRRVANHAGSSSDEGNGTVSGTLEMLEHHYAHQVTDMQRIGCRVKAHIRRRHFLQQLFLRAGHNVMDHASPS